MRLLFITSTLTTGGAEMMLWKLLRELPRDRFQATVASLGPVGRPADLLAGAGFEVVQFGLPGKLLLAPFAAQRLLRRIRPQLIQGWMYHGNMAAWSLAMMTGFQARLIWSIRQSLYDLRDEKPLTRAVIRMNVRLSRRPERIVYVSETSRGQHERLGISGANACVVPNGFDLDYIGRQESQRAQVRTDLEIGPDEILVGHLARFHPAKDQLNLLRAVSKVARQRPGIKFALAGPGLDSSNGVLQKAIADSGVGSQVVLCGETSDPNAFLSACDLFCLSSSAEGFPNALGEAMACELPVVATKVGECEDVVGDCGLLVEPRNPDALAAAVLRLVALDAQSRAHLGEKARRRIMERYSIERVASLYQAIYLSRSTGEHQSRSDQVTTRS
jgi:glycosyltransferase involved in cell wall biosynthesis